MSRRRTAPEVMPDIEEGSDVSSGEDDSSDEHEEAPAPAVVVPIAAPTGNRKRGRVAGSKSEVKDLDSSAILDSTAGRRTRASRGSTIAAPERVSPTKARIEENYHYIGGWRGRERLALMTNTQRLTALMATNNRCNCGCVLQAFEELTEQLDTTHQLALRHQALSPEFAPSSGAPCNTALTPVTLPFDRSTAFDDNKLVRQLQDRFAELQEVLGRVSESEHQNRAVSTSEEAAANSVALR